MIRRELKSRLIELEKRYAAAVEAKRREEAAPARLSRIHAIHVAALILYGEPKIEEPLSAALFRMELKLDKEFAAAAKDCIRKIGREIPSTILCPMLMFDALDGADDNLKFERIFSEAPAWLLKFTGVEWDAKLLGFKLRKLVGAPTLGREARLERNQWPILPRGTIDAGGPYSDPDEPWERIIARNCKMMFR